MGGFQRNGLVAQSHVETANGASIFIGFQNVLQEVEVSFDMAGSCQRQLYLDSLQNVFMDRRWEVSVQYALGDSQRQVVVVLQLPSDVFSKTP